MVALTACGEDALLSDVSCYPNHITPNADHDTDVLKIQYDLGRRAYISIYFDDQDGRRYYFRDHIPHGPSIEDPYQVYFAGVVAGYTLPGETFEDFVVERRVLQDGVYTWTIEALDETGVTEQVTGTLTITEADTTLPELRGFSIHPPKFTPNRDGIDDRVTIGVHLTKDVNELLVYVEDEEGTRYHVEWSEKLTPFHEAGRHEFDYDAGVDRGVDPPPDGVYTVTMQAQDMIGQWTKATGALTIENGGVPRVYILNSEVEWINDGPAVSLPLSSTLYFTLTVENDSQVPIRTSGPPPGVVYDSDQNYATLGEYTQSGVFRVAIHCETSPIDHPWRWAVGGPDDLVEIIHHGESYHYLPAGARARVTGGIRFVDYVAARNPQYCYASLIHEDVEISMVNYRVDPVQLRIEAP